MKKFYLKDGKEVKVGSIIRVQNKTTTPFGEGITSVDVLVTESTIPILIENGVLVTKDDTVSTIKSYIRRVAITHCLDFSEADDFIRAMTKYDKFVALYLLLKAASEEAMCDYDGDSCALIHMHNGRIFEVKNKQLPSHALVFPSVEKANEAIGVLKGLFEEVYGSK